MQSELQRAKAAIAEARRKEAEHKAAVIHAQRVARKRELLAGKLVPVSDSDEYIQAILDLKDPEEVMREKARKEGSTHVEVKVEMD